MTDITDARFLIIATDGFEESELFEPRDQLIGARASVTLASPGREPIQGMKHHEKGATITPDITLSDVDTLDYDALIIPGGVANPDALRQEESAVKIVRAFFDAGKPVAAICHGPWLLAEADVVAGKKVTSWPSLRTDLRNAGADVVDEEVVCDGNLITSRKPGDIPAFMTAIRAAVAEASPETAN